MQNLAIFTSKQKSYVFFFIARVSQIGKSVQIFPSIIYTTKNQLHLYVFSTLEMYNMDLQALEIMNWRIFLAILNITNVQILILLSTRTLSYEKRVLV